MLIQNYWRLALCLTMFAVLQMASVFDLKAQENAPEPELSVVKIRLGDRESGKAFLLEYMPTTGEDGRPVYYFYNKFVDQVMKVTAASFDDPYFVTEIEVFAVGKSYQKAHHLKEKIGYFMTENGIFIGYRQSMTAAMIGIPNLARESRIGPNDVVRKKGAPTERVANGSQETFTYDVPNVALAGDNGGAAADRFDYSARYEFNKRRLKRFVLKISPEKLAERKF